MPIIRYMELLFKVLLKIPLLSVFEEFADLSIFKSFKVIESTLWASLLIFKANFLVSTLPLMFGS